MKACEWCGKALGQRHQKRFCRLKCWYAYQRKHLQGRQVVKAQEVRLAKSREAFRQKMAAEFGPLSDREIALVRKGLRRGYLRCYHALTNPGVRMQGKVQEL